jgi:branched-chain amino acid aminotransferase
MKGRYYYAGQWGNEAPKVVGPGDLGFWSAVNVFDGARSIRGCAPDLMAHCRRLLRSAASVGLAYEGTAEDVHALCLEAIRALPADIDLYIRPMIFGVGGTLLPEEGTTEFTLAVFEMPLAAADAGRATVSPYRRPAPDQAPTDAKAGCLYPNSQRARREAWQRGFHHAVVLDPEGNVAEFSHANLVIGKDGVAITPKPNGTFLNGITRNRTFDLLRAEGIAVEERTLAVDDLHDADEIWMCGNVGKVQAITGFEDRVLQPGPIFRRARELYMAFASTQRVHGTSAPKTSAPEISAA